MDGNGFFVFGGLDEKKLPTNDLYYFRPEIKHNGKTVNKQTGEYMHNIVPEIHLIAKKIDAFGRPPLARC